VVTVAVLKIEIGTIKFRSQESEKRRIEKQPWKLMIELRDEAMMQR